MASSQSFARILTRLEEREKVAALRHRVVSC
jgi:hypothetical protein